MTAGNNKIKARNILLFAGAAIVLTAVGGLLGVSINFANAIIILATVFYGMTAGFVTATGVSLFVNLVALAYTPMEAKTFFALFLLSIAHIGILILIIAVFRGSGFVNFERLAIALVVVCILSPIVSYFLDSLSVSVIVSTPYLQTKAPTISSLLRLYPGTYINSIIASGGYLFLQKYIHKTS